jgi:hypothetical protein
MTSGAHDEAIRQIASTRMPTRWGMFQTLAFERYTPSGTRPVETALAMIMGSIVAHPFAVLHQRGIRVASLRLQRPVRDSHASYC